MAKTAKNSKKKVVLAYSGGLDTSVIIPWLKDNYDCEVIAFAADLGQNDFPSEKALEEKALATGASKCYVLDLKKEFLEDYVWPTVRAGAKYEGTYLLGTSFARPLIAKYQVKIAQMEGAYAVAHGATGKGRAEQIRAFILRTSANSRPNVIFEEFLAEVEHVALGSARCKSLLFKSGFAREVSLAEVCSESNHFAVVVILEPRNNNGSIKSTAVSEDDLFLGIFSSFCHFSVLLKRKLVVHKYRTIYPHLVL